jgi:hypothetical protein
MQLEELSMWWLSVLVGLIHFIFVNIWPRVLVLDPNPLPIGMFLRVVLSVLVCVVSTRGILEAFFSRGIKIPLLIALVGGLTWVIAWDISCLVTPPFPPLMTELQQRDSEPPEFRGFDSLKSDVQSSLERGRQRMAEVEKFSLSLGPTRFMQNISNLGLLAGILGMLSHAFFALMEKESIMEIYKGPVDRRQIHTGDHSPVAMDHGVVDLSVHSSFSGQFQQAVGQVQSLIDKSEAEDRDKKYATLLLETLRREALAPRRDKEKVNSTLKELTQVLEGAKPIAEAASNAMKVLKELVA